MSKPIDPGDLDVNVYRTGKYTEPDIHVVLVHKPSGNVVQKSGKGSEIKLLEKAMLHLRVLLDNPAQW